MIRCPACMGDGFHDHRDWDALVSEAYTDAERWALGIAHPLGIVPCGECEGSGVIDEERAKDIHAASVAAVDQILAKVRDAIGTL